MGRRAAGAVRALGCKGTFAVPVLVTVFVISMLAACAFPQVVPTPAAAPAVRTATSYGPLPATWSAEVSCPGCAPHWLTLTLFPDGTFRLRDRYAGGGRDDSFHDLGQWTVRFGDSQRLLLHGGGEPLRQLRLLPEGDLLLLDAAGHDIRSIRDYVLRRLPATDPLSGPMRLLGLYSRQGEQAWFSECLTGARLRLSGPAAAIAAREHAARYAGRELLAGLEGRHEAAGAGESGDALVVTGFDRFWPGDSCARGAMAPGRPLLGTNWRLVALDGKPAVNDLMANMPAFRLRPKDVRLVGSTGCNRLQAAYMLQPGADAAAGALRLGRPVVGRTRCAPQTMALEQRLLAALAGVSGYRVVGASLILSADDRELLRLQADDMR